MYGTSSGSRRAFYGRDAPVGDPGSFRSIRLATSASTCSRLHSGCSWRRSARSRSRTERFAAKAIAMRSRGIVRDAGAVLESMDPANTRGDQRPTDVLSGFFLDLDLCFFLFPI